MLRSHCFHHFFQIYPPTSVLSPNSLRRRERIEGRGKDLNPSLNAENKISRLTIRNKRFVELFSDSKNLINYFLA